MLCPKCKKEITDAVQFCPECGAELATAKKKKPITKKWWFWVIIIVVVIGLISAVRSGDEDTSGSTGDSNVVQEDESSVEKTTEKAAETTTVKTVFNVGDSVNDGNLKITYVSAEEWTGYNQYSKPDDGNKIIRVKFDFINEGENDAYINSFYCYADNQSANEYYYAEDSLSVYTISSGRTTSGYKYFEVPENAQDIEIEYEVNFWSDKKAIFKVEL